jgi:hypothetical protein
MKLGGIILLCIFLLAFGTSLVSSLVVWHWVKLNFNIGWRFVCVIGYFPACLSYHIGYNAMNLANNFNKTVQLLFFFLYHSSPICWSSPSCRFIKHSLKMKASRYLRVLLAKARCDWCMETSCITSTGTGKETIEHSIACGVAGYNEWVQQPDNASQRNKDNKMVPYLKRHFIYINYAKSMYHMGSGKVTNLPSCVL